MKSFQILFLFGSSIFLSGVQGRSFDGVEQESEEEDNQVYQDEQDSRDGFQALEYAYNENVQDEEHEVLKRQATDSFRQKALQLHNQYRARHGSPPLTIDQNLNREAQSYADHEARTNVQKHSCGPCDKYGENLAYTAGTQAQPRDVAAADWACKAWYDEISLYNFGNPNFSSSSKWGHFTALVWKSTQRVGFGVTYGTKISASGNKMNTVYVVARYFPPGNVWSADEMRRNVPPPQG